MNVIVSLEHRFDRTPDGAVWTPTTFAHAFWRRYLKVFDGVRIVARVRPVSSVPSGWHRADGPAVSFCPVPYYLGPWQYLLRAGPVRRAARGAIRREGAVVLRVGSQIAAAIHSELRRSGHPYGLEIVGDPSDVFSPGAVRHPLRPLFRWWFVHTLRVQCAQASAVAYVTAETLQRRYPAAPGAFATHYSNVELPESAFVSAPRAPKQDGGPLTLITIGSLEQLYKAPDILIDALAVLTKEGFDLRLIFLGDGRYRRALEKRAGAAGLGGRVFFLGYVPAGDAVRAQVDKADLFLLPSKTEGLPRALIEAMARALPCVGSTAGGIPELLPDEDMVPPGDAATLARKIREVVTDPGRMARMSARNLSKAREYREDILDERRRAFYEHLRRSTEAWLAQQGSLQ